MTDLVNTMCNLLQKGVLGLFADFEVVGRESVPPMGPVRSSC